MNFRIITRYIKDVKGIAATETAILFPVMFVLIMGVYDLGQGVVINQKVNTASQVIGDLITRYEVADTAIIQDVVMAGELALSPFPLDNFGYDIVSVEFDENGDAFTLWRRTENMLADGNALSDAVGLGDEGEGVVVVSVEYKYAPFFSNFFIEGYTMRERSFLRGRKSVTVPCSDC